MSDFYKLLDTIFKNKCARADLSCKNIGEKLDDKHAIQFAEALKGNTSLTYLNLDYNDIGDEGAAKLAEMLKENKTLKTFKFTYNSYSYTSSNALEEAILKSNNPNIVEVTLGENDELSEELTIMLNRNKKSIPAQPAKDHRAGVTESKTNSPNLGARR